MQNMDKRMKMISITLIALMTLLLADCGGILFAAPNKTASVNNNYVEQVADAQAALESAGSIEPEEGIDSNVVTMAQAIVNRAVSGVKVGIASSSNPAVASSGRITYGTSDVSGEVIFTLTLKNASATQGVTIDVPAKEVIPTTEVPVTTTPTPTTETTSTSGTITTATVTTTTTPTTTTTSTTTKTTVTRTDAEEVTAAQTALAAAAPLIPVEGTDTNIVPLAQKLVDRFASDVTVTLLATYNPQISATGDITYLSSARSNSVRFGLSKNAASAWQNVMVTIPATAVTYATCAPATTTVAATTTTPATTTSTTTTTTTSTTSTATLIPPATPITTTDPIPADAFNVKDFGAKGDGTTADTTAINAAINAANAQGGGTVYVPDGVYIIPITGYNQISMKSNVKLQMAQNAVIKAKYQSSTYTYNHATIRARDVDNIEICGGTITGIKAERDVANEVGHGIAIQGCDNVYIHDITSNWNDGDGIFISTSSNQAYSSEVLVENFLCEYNNRQGVTIESARNTTIRNGECAFQYRSNPQSGIDIEPVNANWFVENVLIENMYCHDNGTGTWYTTNYCYGIEVGFGWVYNNGLNNPVSLTIQNCRVADNGRDVDNEQINYANINAYKTKPNLSNIVISGITYQ